MKATAPALCGAFRPCLLLPEDLADRLSGRELELVFLHELAHLKRGDLLVTALASVLAALHWFNPAVWLAFARWRSDRELACDEAVLSRVGADQARTYGHTILNVLAGLNGTGRVPGSVAVAEDRRQIRRRITMIARFKHRNWTAALPGAVAMVVLAAVALTSADSGTWGTARWTRSVISTRSS